MLITRILKPVGHVGKRHLITDTLVLNTDLSKIEQRLNIEQVK